MYTSKKQSHSKNTSTVLANHLAFHNLQERTDQDSINRNKRLLTHCVNSISHDQEFSAPEVTSYIMGWGDHYISHHFVPIHCDSATAALKKTFPGLKRKTLGIMSSICYMFFDLFAFDSHWLSTFPDEAEQLDAAQGPGTEAGEEVLVCCQDFCHCQND